ncbi:hypothetical protein DSM03_104238 [Leeuwenhoekiella aestuarii]|uniref:Uncharacterized protein n=1 Tax=Leeuwenhoekiella aestuarii TaxID=2249426 RepID=A0A4Q0NRY7_9FLAO|nr:hypothetical protein DSM04_105162 [Leeuwenhoekiella aestuarii]RXG15080.1 hypothetical protein DSM03_104238 [Leeuwenhoekiella aestuarii]
MLIYLNLTIFIAIIVKRFIKIAKTFYFNVVKTF